MQHPFVEFDAESFLAPSPDEQLRIAEAEFKQARSDRTKSEFLQTAVIIYGTYRFLRSRGTGRITSLVLAMVANDLFAYFENPERYKRTAAAGQKLIKAQLEAAKAAVKAG